MDPIVVGIIAVVSIGVVLYAFRSEDEPAPTPKKKPQPAVQVQSSRAPAKPAVKTLPGNAALNSLTKAGLEDLGREMGVELDKRKTKAKMITDLRLGVK